MPDVKTILENARIKASEDLSDEKLEQLFAKAVEQPRAKNLEVLWRCVYLRSFPGKFFKAWTYKDKAQINAMVREIGGQVVACIIREIIPNWSSFSAKAQQAAGWKDPGVQPRIWFLVYHRDLAVDWVNEFSASTCVEDDEGEGPSWDF